MLPTLALLSVVIFNAPSPSGMWEPLAVSPRKPVQYVDGKPVILLDDMSVQDDGHYAFVDTSPYVVRSAMAAPPSGADANDTARQWLGQRVYFYGVDGARCVDKVGGLANYAWFDAIQDDDGATPTATEIWARGSHYVAAEIHSAACQDAVYAELAAHAATDVAMPQAASAEQRQVALTALPRALAFQRIQNRFVREHHQQSGDYGAEARPATERWGEEPIIESYAIDRRTFLSVRMLAEGHCGDFDASLLLVWELVARDGKHYVEERYESTDSGAPLLLFADKRTGHMQIEREPVFYIPNDMEGDGCGC